MADNRSIRSVRQIVSGSRQTDGAGVRLVRVIGHRNVTDFDPFLMLDAFDSTDPADYVKGFPWHPHRGIETITYLVKGRVEHGDSLGNQGIIEDGCCQWMTAGGGIIHQEMPQPSPRMLGLQLWLNLPAKDKMTRPQYRDLTAGMIPLVHGDGSRTAIIAGSFQDRTGATSGDYVPATLLAVELEPGMTWTMDTDPEATVFTYAFAGTGMTGSRHDEAIESRKAVLFQPGGQLSIRAGDSGIHFVVAAGRPLGEPVAWGGPIVMNTQAELDQAFADLRQGTFIRT